MKALLTGITACLLAGGVPAAELAFVNVNVIPMSGDSVLESRTVVIADGRIARIGSVESTVVADDTQVIDGTDRYLMPGLSEMHAHVPGANSPALERVLNLYLANGVTRVRGMLGQPSHLRLRQRLANGSVPGPRLVTSGPSFNGNSVSSPRQGAQMVARQQAAGYDFLKIHPGLSAAEFAAIAAEARRLGIRFAGHVPADVGVPAALEHGISTIDHLDGYLQTLVPVHEDPTGGYEGFFGVALAGVADAALIGPVVASTAKAGTWNVPTQSLFENMMGADDPEAMRNWPEMKYMPAATVQDWVQRKRDAINAADFDRDTADRAIALRRDLILALHRNGAGLLLGSDAPQTFNVPGFSLHRELALLVESGLTPAEALATGTVNAARWFGIESDVGTVEAGKQADLVLLDDNPLNDIGNTRRVHGVMLGGRWHDRDDLDRLLARYVRNF